MPVVVVVVRDRAQHAPADAGYYPPGRGERPVVVVVVRDDSGADDGIRPTRIEDEVLPAIQARPRIGSSPAGRRRGAASTSVAFARQSRIRAVVVVVPALTPLRRARRSSSSRSLPAAAAAVGLEVRLDPAPQLIYPPRRILPPPRAGAALGERAKVRSGAFASNAPCVPVFRWPLREYNTRARAGVSERFLSSILVVPILPPSSVPNDK